MVVPLVFGGQNFDKNGIETHSVRLPEVDCGCVVPAGSAV